MNEISPDPIDRHGPAARTTRFLTSHSEAWVCCLALLIYWLVQAAVNAWWLWADTRPPFWDTAGHATQILQLAKLFDQDSRAILNGLLSVWPYPPFAYLVSVPFVFLFGRSIDVIVLTHVVFLGILYFSVYRIGCHFDRPRTGLAAAFLVGVYPMICGLSRHTLLDVPLTAMVALSVSCLLATRHFGRLVPSLLFGVSLGLGMLTKWTFAVFVGGPALVVAVNSLRATPWKAARNMTGSLLLGGLIAVPWYIHNLPNLRRFLPEAQNAGVLEGDPVSLWGTSSYYALQLVNEQVLLPFVVLFVVGLVLFLRRHKTDEPSWALLAWMVIPYVAFSYHANKDPRYTLPFLPALALITALGCSYVRSARTVRVGVGLVALYAVLQFAGLSFGLARHFNKDETPLRYAVKVGDSRMTVYSERVHIASPPVVQDWKQIDVLRDVMGDASGSGRAPGWVNVVVMPNASFFEPQGFIYLTHANEFPVDITFVTGVGDVDSSAKMAACDYVVTKTGNLGPSWTLQDAEALTASFEQGDDRSGSAFTRLREYALPDGSVAHLYRRNRE